MRETERFTSKDTHTHVTSTHGSEAAAEDIGADAAATVGSSPRTTGTPETRLNAADNMEDRIRIQGTGTPCSSVDPGKKCWALTIPATCHRLCVRLCAAVRRCEGHGVAAEVGSAAAEPPEAGAAAAGRC